MFKVRNSVGNEEMVPNRMAANIIRIRFTVILSAALRLIRMIYLYHRCVSLKCLPVQMKTNVGVLGLPWIKKKEDVKSFFV